MSTANPRIAQIGPYTVLEEIGRGAMGVVFRGFDPSIARPVAIKVIRPQQLDKQSQIEEARKRFVREANAAGRLSHNNIVTVYQLGEDRGYQYMAMEFVDGQSLNKLMSPNNPMDPEIALSILRQIADGLDYAHSQGVVHRDIKPANILVRADRVVKIADFGIAHVTSQTLTQPGTTLGTLAYIAPEQLQGLRVDGRADQFSLAIIAYQMLSGARPFGAASEHSLMREIMSADPRPITEINSALGPRVTAVLRRGLAKDPLLRFNTCSDMIRALKASIMEPEPEAAKPAVAPAPPPARKSNWIWIAGGVAALAVVAVVAIVFARSSAPRGPGVSVPHADVQQATTPAPPVASKTAITKSIPSPAVPAAAAPANRNPEARAVRPRTVDSQSNAPDFDNVHAAPRSKSSAPPALTPDQLKAKYEHDQKLATLDAKRQQLQTELLQAQRELVDLRTRYKDNAPEVQAAIERVQNLHTALTDVTNQVIDLKSQLGVHN